MEAVASGSDSKAKAGLVVRAWQIFCQLLLRTSALVFLPLFAKVTIHGRRHLRDLKTPVILAANHKTYLDPLLIGLALPVFSNVYPLRFIAKDEFFLSVWKRYIFRSLACLRSYYGQGLDISLAAPRRVLQAGGCLVIFPEGSMVPGDELESPRRGIGALAKTFPQVPIVPIAIRGANAVRAWRFLFRRPEIIITVGEPFTVSPDAGDYPAASEFIMNRIKKEYLVSDRA